MKVYQTNEIKNIALLGSSGSGKTTLVEAMLFESGVIKRRGSVAAKNTVSDYFPVEQEYGYSVFSTVLHVEWNNKKLNIIDCPGSDDFVGSTVTALNVTDTAIILLNGQYGVEVGTQNHFRYTEKLNKPVIFLVNQLDNEKCDYDNILEQLKEAYGSKVVPIQYPIATGPGFNALIDVLLMKKYSWKPEGGAPVIEDIPAEEMDKAMEMHKALVEAAAENDEGLMEKFFEQDSLTEDEMREGIRKGLIARGMFPVFCVCGGKDMGVRRLMEFLGNVVPFVSEMPKVENTDGKEVAPDVNGPESLYFFKTSVEPHIGEVSYFKVMSGKVREGDDLLNADRGSKERIAQIYVVAGGNRVKVEELQAGDIGAAVKLKDVKTGNTLNGKDCDYKFNFIKYPNSKYSRAIKPVNEADVEKMMTILNRMREEDPTWVIEQSKELKQTLVHGQGEFHLRTLKWRLENNEKLQVKFEEPKIPYRETITKAARADDFTSLSFFPLRHDKHISRVIPFEHANDFQTICQKHRQILAAVNGNVNFIAQKHFFKFGRKNALPLITDCPEGLIQNQIPSCVEGDNFGFQGRMHLCQCRQRQLRLSGRKQTFSCADSQLFHCSPSFLMISSISAWDTFPFFSKARRKICRSTCSLFPLSAKAAFTRPRTSAITSITSAKPVGMASSICSRMKRAAKGLAPPVEKPATNAPRFTRAGKKKLHFSASSTILTGICFAWQTAAILALTASQSVAPMTKHISSTSSA